MGGNDTIQPKRNPSLYMSVYKVNYLFDKSGKRGKKSHKLTKNRMNRTKIMFRKKQQILFSSLTLIQEDYNNTGAHLQRHKYGTSYIYICVLTDCCRKESCQSYTHTHTNTQRASFISSQMYSNKLWWSDQSHIKICPIKLDAGNVTGKCGTFIKVINFPCWVSGQAYEGFETWTAARPPEHEMNSQD